jgi:membrane protein implicated in regulation of membrane protease activity
MLLSIDILVPTTLLARSCCARINTKLFSSKLSFSFFPLLLLLLSHCGKRFLRRFDVLGILRICGYGN